MTRPSIGLLACLLATTVQYSAIAESSKFYQDEEQGWFFYNEIVEPEEQKEEEPEEPVPAPPPPPPEPKEAAPASVPEGPKALSTAWFRKNLGDYLDAAIDNPSAENVEAYFLLQRIAMDKAQQFAETSRSVIEADAILDESINRPLGDGMQNALDREARLNKERLMSQLSNEIGIGFFYDTDCRLCPQMAGTLRVMKRQYGMNYLGISMDGNLMPEEMLPESVPNNGQAEALGVDRAPAMFIMQPPNNWYIFSRSSLTLGDLVDRVLRVAHENGLLTDQEINSTKSQLQHTVRPKEFNTLDEFPTDPAEIVELLRGIYE